MKKLSKGFTLVELLVVIGILGILMAALFPSISGAMLTAQMSAMSSRGRKLVTAIIASNTDRMQNGASTLWPMQNTEGLSDRDKEVIGASSAKDYFNKLLDMQNRGTQDADPFVLDVGVEELTGPGVPTKAGSGELEANNIAWLIVQNLGYDNVEDTMPALVSRNVDYSALQSSLTTYNGSDTTKLKCGNGTYKTPFGDKGWVVVYKGGGVKTFKAKDSRLNNIFKGQFDYSDLEYQMKFLLLN